MLKAIETVYGGYRFRSRLEARWACFFDAMGVKWEYEKEGYDLDGMWYLPDFWLPELDCFIEIKGHEIPECDEISKAFWLAWHSGKQVYICCGNDNFSGESSAILGLGSVFLEVSNEENVLRRGPLSITKETCELYGWNPLGKGLRCLDEIEEELSQLLSYPGDDSRHPVAAKLYLREFHLSWTECPFCRKVTINFEGFITRMDCGCIQKYGGEYGWEEGDGDVSNWNSPRILEAFTIARQSRFEHGEGKTRVSPIEIKRKEGKTKPPVIHLDPDDSYSIGVEIAMELDRQYFKDHPGETSYTRSHVENEWPLDVYEEGGEVIEVMVNQIQEGLRTRVPVFRKMKQRISSQSVTNKTKRKREKKLRQM